MEKATDHSSSGDHKFEWYLFIDNRYRGPYSFEQIDSALRMGNLSVNTLTWKQGMSDWEQISGIPELATSAAEAPVIPARNGFPNGQLAGLDEPALADTMEFLEDISSEESPGFEVSFPMVVPQHEEPQSPMSFSAEPTVRVKIPRAYMGLVALLAIATGSLGYYLYLMIFAFPQLPGVYGEELRDLERAAKQPLVSSGAIGHVALVPGSTSDPRFYVASNLGDGATVELSIEGISETLVDTLEFKSSMQVRLSGWVTKTPVFRQKDGKRLPMGEYNLRLASRGQTIAQRTLFLGGAKDSTYEAKLKMYHSALKLQAEAEIDEIRQLADTVESQLAEMRSSSRLNQRWMGVQRQIEFMFQGWTTEGLDKEFYYGSLYLLIKQAAEAMSKKEIVKAEDAILALRAKMALAERQGVDGSGIPRRIKD